MSGTASSSSASLLGFEVAFVKALDQCGAPGAVAAVVGVPGHGCVAAGGAEKPFSVGTRMHKSKLTFLHAVRTADDLVFLRFYALHLNKERLTFAMDGTTSII
jgi:hypothetical protein